MLLALGLSVVVIASISSAIQLYMVALAKQQSKIEQKQVARAVLVMIENDVRAAIQYVPEDYSSLENPDSEELIVDEEVTSFRPAFLGSSGLIMIDISRLPRLDQYNPLIESDFDEVRSPSDVKSVAYFVSLSEGGVERQVEFATPRAPGGLYRREIDRAVAAYIGDDQPLSSPDEYTELIANEIAQVSFRFFDGEDWQDEWDSYEQGGFPVSVEILLAVDPERSAPGSQSYTYSSADQDSVVTYRKVVNLPVARPTANEEEG